MLTVKWRLHAFRGWFCVCCGYRALRQADRDVHERRALRGLGCSDGNKTPNVRGEAATTAAKEQR